MIQRRPPLPDQVRAYAPEFLRKLTLILLALRGVVANAFGPHPTLGHIAVIVWRRVAVATQRATSLANRLAAGRRPRLYRPRPSRVRTTPRKPVLRLPTARLFLVKHIGWRASGCASQLRFFLDEPETKALLAEAPSFARVLRPLARILGVTTLDLPPRPRRPRPPKPPRPERVTARQRRAMLRSLQSRPIQTDFTRKPPKIA